MCTYMYYIHVHVQYLRCQEVHHIQPVAGCSHMQRRVPIISLLQIDVLRIVHDHHLNRAVCT